MTRSTGAQLRIIPLLVAFPLFMVNLDQTILLIAIPEMARQFDTPASTLSILVTSYLLALVASMPLSGWLTARLGSKTVFLGAVGLFSVGSLLCGLSQSLPLLCASRVLQGLGGGLLTPVARLILQERIPRERMIQAMVWYTTPALLGPMLGPALGGWLLSITSWNWIFFVNLPVGLAAILLCLAVLRGNSTQRERQPFDLLGYALICAGLILLFMSFSRLESAARLDLHVLVLLAGGAIALGAYAVAAKRSAAPIINLAVLRNDLFRRMVAGGSWFRLPTAALPFLLSIVLQSELGLTSAVVGGLLSCTAIGALCAKPLVRTILRKMGYRALLISGTCAAALLMGVVFLLGGHGSLTLLPVVLLASGFVRSVQFTAINSLTYTSVEPHLNGSATTLSSILQQVSIGLGVVLASVSMAMLESFGFPEAGMPTLLIVAALSLIALFWFIPLHRRTGEELIAG